MSYREELPCRRYVASLERDPPLEGALTLEHGFIPAWPNRAELPVSHRPWDAVAADLPDLFLSNRTQRVLERLPRLDATARALPDEALARASVVLSALGHAYWRFGAQRFFPRRTTQVDGALPPSILVPWREVSERLGRHEPERPFQSFYDLFLANYRFREGRSADAPKTIENLEVLVPSFRNEAERVFYMSFVEMHHHLTPLVRAVCDIEAGIFADDADAVLRALTRIHDALVRATGVWQKISARAGSRTFCDPMLWSKTAAILGVPPDGTPQGATSGASAPMLHVLDALLGRNSYESRYGRFLLEHTDRFVAASVLRFVELVRRLPLQAYLERHASSVRLQEAFDTLVSAYAGGEGWLGRHTAKVFNYLCISTISGRNASVSGDERYFRQQTWIEATAELHESRVERTVSAGGCPVSGARLCSAREEGAVEPAAVLLERVSRCSSRPIDELPVYSRLEVVRRCMEGEVWLMIGGLVYDVTTYVEKHPGGAAILRAHAGQEVTEIFWSQLGHRTDAVAALLTRHLEGRLSEEPGCPPSRLYRAVEILMRCLQSSRLQYDHPLDGRLGLKLMSDENAHMLLLEENLPPFFELLAPGLWEFLARGEAARQVRESAQSLSVSVDFRGELPEPLKARIRKRCHQLRDADLGLLVRLQELVLGALASERDAPRSATLTESSEPSGIPVRLVLAFRRELERYFELLAPGAAWDSEARYSSA